MSGGMIWLKYYTAVIEESGEVGKVLQKFGHDGYGKYWHLMGMLGKKFNEHSKTTSLTDRYLRDCLRFNSRKKLESFLLSPELQTIFKTTKNEDEYIFDNGILLELKSRDFKTTRSERRTTAYKNKSKSKNKSKNIDIDIYAFAKQTIEFWNASGLIQEKILPESIQEVERLLQEKLKSGFGQDQVTKAISNYTAITNVDGCWFDHRFKLRDFLTNTKAQDRFYAKDFSLDSYVPKTAQPEKESAFEN